jgi:hexosaminidase|eukprot:g4026.t1
MRFFTVLFALATLVTASSATSSVWPPPKRLSVAGPKLRLAPDFEIRISGQRTLLRDGRLSRGVERFTESIRKLGAGNQGADTREKFLRFATVSVQTLEGNGVDEVPTEATVYDYEIRVASNEAVLTAPSVFGALYAMESFSQLLSHEAKGSYLLGDNVTVHDSPDYAWRGLMVDSGRRFVNVETMENLMDTMAAVKLNVLHLHASDRCRWSVESKLYPNLTESLTGLQGGFYTQKDVAGLIAYAADRGIRVVPEFDVPGHSRGLRPIESKGIEFCKTDESKDQLYGDPEGNTYKVIYELMQEMSGLFKDQVFNIGCDETTVEGKCTLNSTFAFERKLLSAIATDFKKVPETWEEGLFDANAATMDTVVNAWARHNASEIIMSGRKAVESKDEWFYFTAAAKGGPEGWTPCWNDISYGVPSDKMDMLLGGEMSMWTDTYCFIDQCGAYPPNDKPALPVGSKLYGPDTDAAFAKSIGGMIWPRGYVAAAAFWHYDSTVDPSSKKFVESVWRMNDKVAKQGGYVCPTNCTCDQNSACGTPYLK